MLRSFNRSPDHVADQQQTGFGFVILYAFIRQGASEDIIFVSGRILLLVTLLAGENFIHIMFTRHVLLRSKVDVNSNLFIRS